MATPVTVPRLGDEMESAVVDAFVERIERRLAGRAQESEQALQRKAVLKMMPLPPDAGLSGLLLPAAGEIWVNAAEAREWPPRRRFTIGHELGLTRERVRQLEGQALQRLAALRDLSSVAA